MTMGPASSRRATSSAQLTHVALQLFFKRGFDETTVDDIARAAGIGRRTFFRYFASKNDVPWGDFDGLVAQFRTHLASIPESVPVIQALHEAVVRFNDFPASELEYHRKRMELLLRNQTLVAHSTLRFEAWRNVVAEFVAERRGSRPDDLQPQVIGWAYMAASVAAYEEWLRRPRSSLTTVLDTALTHLEAQFGRDES